MENHNKIIASAIVAVLLLMGAGSSLDQHAFYIPFFSRNNYDASLDESLDPDNITEDATQSFNGSDY